MPLAACHGFSSVQKRATYLIADESKHETTEQEAAAQGIQTEGRRTNVTLRLRTIIEDTKRKEKRKGPC